MDLLSPQTKLLATYEARLTTWLAGLLKKRIVEKDTGAVVDLPTPWVAVALAYSHGLSFGLALGVLPEEESDELELDGTKHLNPAEWSRYEFLAEPKPLRTVTHKLETLARDSDVAVTPRLARQIHVRVATALRATLLEAGKLHPTGLVYATDFERSEMLDNVRASNPPRAIKARASWLK